jgi:hypothetical protein
VLSSVLKVLFWLVAAVAASVGLLIAWIYIELKFLYPRQFVRLQEEATAWNRENWETGHALRVIVQVSSDVALGSETKLATVDCYKKRIARGGGLKGPPSNPAVTFSDGPEVLSLAFGPGATHTTPLREICWDVLRKNDEWELPYITESHYYWSYIEVNDQSFSCFLGSDPRTTRGAITRPTFASVERVPLRELLTADAYEALPRPKNRPYRPTRPKYSWRIGAGEAGPYCWREASNQACAPEVGAICGSPFR